MPKHERHGGIYEIHTAFRPKVFPGTGDVGIPALIQKLRDCGYQGLLCPEHLGPEPPGRDLEADAVAYAKELIRG